jgi:hypothetical protein
MEPAMPAAWARSRFVSSLYASTNRLYLMAFAQRSL